MHLMAEDRKFDLEVDLCPCAGEPRSIPASLRAVNNGVFELCAPSYFSPGARLELRTRQRHFESRVVCCERLPAGSFRLGLVIAGDEERRTETRVPADIPAVLRIRNSLQTLAVRVVDVSPSGLGLDLPAPIPVGASVQVGLNGGMGVGEICHCARKLDRYRAGMRMREFILHPTTRQEIALHQGKLSPIDALVSSIRDRQSRYEAILFSLVASQGGDGR